MGSFTLFGSKSVGSRSVGATGHCSSGGHVPDQAAVKHDGGKLMAPCRKCGEALTLKVGGWRAAEQVDRWGRVSGFSSAA